MTKVEGEVGPELDETLICDAAGRFYRKEQVEWGLYIIPMDPFGTRYQAVATAEGHQSAPHQFGPPWMTVRFMGLGSTDVADLGDVTVQRQ